MDSTITSAFTPTGILRASINLGNPILAKRDEHEGAVGISVDLATEFARLLGADLELVVVDTAAKSVDVVRGEDADIGFFAIDPLRSDGIQFTAPYILIQGSYLVRADSPIRSNADVDHAANRVTVGAGSAYDLFLTRHLKSARIERAPTSPGVVDFFLENGHEVAAGVRQQLEADARRLPGLYLLPENFMTIQQAVGTPASRGEAAGAFLSNFVERMKCSGFIAEAMKRHHIDGANVAPLSDVAGLSPSA
jgi:polar amino acid transport system substrate-binding protein